MKRLVVINECLRGGRRGRELEEGVVGMYEMKSEYK